MQRFTGAFEETKRELEGLTHDLDHSLSLQLAAKLNCEELPQKLQEASLVSRATLQAQVKQVSQVFLLIQDNRQPQHISHSYLRYPHSVITDEIPNEGLGYVFISTHCKSHHLQNQQANDGTTESVRAL